MWQPPPKTALVWTNDEDPIDYYYKPIIGYFYRKRIQLVLNLIKHYTFDRLIDIGYGCGLLFPALSEHAHRLFGLENHGKHAEVRRRIKKLGVDVTLYHGDLRDLSSLPKNFDAITLVSVLEHIKEIDSAARELAAIQPRGTMLFCGSPVKNKITDLIFTLFGFDYEKHHPSSHRAIINALGKHYRILKLTWFPRFLPLDYSLYFAFSARKK